MKGEDGRSLFPAVAVSSVVPLPDGGVIVKNSCPYYRYKEEEGKVTSCDGDVIWEPFAAYGVCQVCGKEIPYSVEM